MTMDNDGVCTWYKVDPDPYYFLPEGIVRCKAVATHMGHTDITGWHPVCQQHACRHALTLEEHAKLTVSHTIPSHWMAL